MELKFDLKNGEQILLRSDSMNYEMCSPRQRTNNDSGELEMEWAAHKWFASLPQALGKVLEMKVRHSDATDLKQLRADLEAARAEIMSAWSTAI